MRMYWGPVSTIHQFPHVLVFWSITQAQLLLSLQVGETFMSLDNVTHSISGPFPEYVGSSPWIWLAKAKLFGLARRCMFKPSLQATYWVGLADWVLDNLPSWVAMFKWEWTVKKAGWAYQRRYWDA